MAYSGDWHRGNGAGDKVRLLFLKNGFSQLISQGNTHLLSSGIDFKVVMDLPFLTLFFTFLPSSHLFSPLWENRFCWSHFHLLASRSGPSHGMLNVCALGSQRAKSRNKRVCMRPRALLVWLLWFCPWPSPSILQVEEGRGSLKRAGTLCFILSYGEWVLLHCQWVLSAFWSARCSQTWLIPSYQAHWLPHGPLGSYN